ncbi:MAG: DUF421 domain-containing protein [Candidatus Dormibacteria bacterium]
MGDLTHLAIAPWDIVVRCLCVYLVLLLGLRLFGKRQLGQFTIFDLVLVLLVANAVQPAMTGPDSSLLGGFLIIGTLLLLNFLVSQGRVRSKLLRRMLEPPATVLATGGKWIPAALHHQGMDMQDVAEALHEHGVSDVKDTVLVELEPDGSISVVDRQGQRVRARRRSRFVRRP